MSNPSVTSKWPTKENNTKFKFDSFYFQMNPTMIKIERATYSALDWLGDVGGLFDGLKIIASLLVAPISALAANDILLTQVFKFMPSQRDPAFSTSKAQSAEARI